MNGGRRSCYAPSHSESELTRLSWRNFASFCRYQQALASLALGFQAPAKEFCKQAAQLLNRASSPRQMLGADYVLKAAVDELLSRIQNSKSLAPRESPQKPKTKVPFIRHSPQQPTAKVPIAATSAPMTSSETTSETAIGMRLNSRSEVSTPSSQESERRRVRLHNMKTPPKGGSGLRLPARRTNVQT